MRAVHSDGIGRIPSYVESVAVDWVSFRCDDRRRTWNYRDGPVPHTTDVTLAERICDCTRPHWSRELPLVFRRAGEADGGIIVMLLLVRLSVLLAQPIEGWAHARVDAAAERFSY